MHGSIVHGCAGAQLDASSGAALATSAGKAHAAATKSPQIHSLHAPHARNAAHYWSVVGRPAARIGNSNCELGGGIGEGNAIR